MKIDRKTIKFARNPVIRDRDSDTVDRPAIIRDYPPVIREGKGVMGARPPVSGDRKGMNLLLLCRTAACKIGSGSYNPMLGD